METIEKVTLSKDDIYAMRKATRAYLHHGNPDRYRNYLLINPSINDAGIELHLPTKGNTLHHPHYHLPIESSRVIDYSVGRTPPGSLTTEQYNVFHCRAWDSGYSPTLALLPIADLARPGDWLSIEWLRGNDSDLLRERDLSIDECRLHLHRRLKDGSDREWVCKIDQSCTLNDFTRIVRRNGENV